MKFVVSLLAAIAFALSLTPSHALAQEAPAMADKKDESIKQDDAIFHHVPQNLQDRFSTSVFFHGVASQTGFGLGIETPFAWDAVALRLAISSDNVTATRGSTFSFYTFQAALKLQFDVMSSANLYPYVLIGYDAISGVSSSNGSKHAIESLVGADWRYVSTPVFSKNIRIVRAFFIEAGAVRSNLEIVGSTTASQVSDGFMGRIGFRTFL